MEYHLGYTHFGEQPAPDNARKSLLMLPPLGLNAAYFDELGRLAQDDYGLVGIDPAGFGSSVEVPGGGYTIDDHAALLSATIDTLVEDGEITRPFVLGGASFGGRIALRSAAEMVRTGAPNMEAIHGLAIFNPPVIEGPTAERSSAVRTASLFSWLMARDRWSVFHKALVRSGVAGLYAEAIEGFHPDTARGLKEFDVDAYRKTVEGLIRDKDLTEEPEKQNSFVKDLEVVVSAGIPTTVVYGPGDRWFSSETETELQQLERGRGVIDAAVALTVHKERQGDHHLVHRATDRAARRMSVVETSGQRLAGATVTEEIRSYAAVQGVMPPSDAKFTRAAMELGSATYREGRRSPDKQATFLAQQVGNRVGRGGVALYMEYIGEERRNEILCSDEGGELVSRLANSNCRPQAEKWAHEAGMEFLESKKGALGISSLGAYHTMMGFMQATIEEVEQYEDDPTGLALLEIERRKSMETLMGSDTAGILVGELIRLRDPGNENHTHFADPIDLMAEHAEVFMTTPYAGHAIARLAIRNTNLAFEILKDYMPLLSERKEVATVIRACLRSPLVREQTLELIATHETQLKATGAAELYAHEISERTEADEKDDEDLWDQVASGFYSYR